MSTLSQICYVSYYKNVIQTHSALLTSVLLVTLKISNLLSKLIILVHFHPLGLTSSTEFLSFKTPAKVMCFGHKQLSVFNKSVY